jgi:SanA protein
MEAASPARSRWLRAIAVVALVMAVAVAGFGAHEAVLADAAAILVPGARIHPDGRPYPMLQDRLQTALDLFLAGKAKRIVLSGEGGGAVQNDEVAAMRRWLLARGVEPAAMLEDPAGLRTIDTMRNCRSKLGIERVIVVSNEFHLPRCLFLAGHSGLDAQGVVAAPGFAYSAATLTKNRTREVFARLWAFGEVRFANR